MKKIEITKFIDRFSKDKIVCWMYDKEDTTNLFNDSDEYASTIMIFKKREFGVDALLRLKNSMAKMADTEVKAVLLHELGHLNNQENKKNQSLYEADAHIWAINQCLKFKMHDVLTTILFLWMSWAHENWKTHRIYRLAYHNIKKRLSISKSMTVLLEKFEQEAYNE